MCTHISNWIFIFIGQYSGLGFTPIILAIMLFLDGQFEFSVYKQKKTEKTFSIKGCAKSFC